MNSKGCPSSPITASASIPPWERDRSVVRPAAAPVERQPKPSTAQKKRRKRSKPAVAKRRGPVRYAEYMASKTWAKKRRKALKRSGYKCDECGACDRLEVHHLTYKRLGCEPLGDLQVLCFDCHQVKHENKYTPKDRLSVEFRNAVRAI